MKRCVLLLVALGAMAGVTAPALQDPEAALYLAWARKAEATTPTVAIVVEMGLKDANVRDWSGSAVVKGAKVVRREGYRFRKGDQLTGDNGWQVSSHRPMRGPIGKPGVTKLEPIASVGVVLQLQDVEASASITIQPKEGDAATVPLADVLAGKTQSLWNGAGAVRLISTAHAIVDAATEDDYPAAAFGPDGSLYVVYNSYRVRDEARRIEPPMLKEQPKDFASYVTPEAADQVIVRVLHKGTWGKPIVVTGPNEDIARCAIAVTAAGEVHIVYSAQRQGNFDLYTRHGSGDLSQLSAEERLTTNAGPDLGPVMTTGSQGNVWAAYQSWSEQGRARIGVLRNKNGKWTQEEMLEGPGNCWHPSIAATPKAGATVAFDCYQAGSYDVMLALVHHGKATYHRVAATPKFEARPAIVYDAAGTLWVAYEEGPAKWGKDYGAFDSADGMPLYNERNVRVVCFDGNQWKTPVAKLPLSTYKPPQLPFDGLTSNNFERVTRYGYPKIGIGGDGRVWLSYRQNFGTRYTTHPGPYWLDFVRRLDGDQWSPAVELHHSDSLLDARPTLLPHQGGGLLVIHGGDGRYTTPEVLDNQLFASVVNLPGPTVSPLLAVHNPGQHVADKQVLDEQADVARMRGYRAQHQGKTYQYLRGEYHRHTEISWDGASDGSLEDMFRYAIDCAAMDWIGNGDHDNGAGREYSWWLTQKWSDAYRTGKAFTPMHTYERSVAYPHGHRNVMFDRRGIRTLPRLAPPDGVKQEAGVHADDTKMLYRYLRELGGVCAVHTSATSMGTDWRDNDPAVEPIVEIYQGDRMSYEVENSPRAGFDPALDKFPPNVAGWFPKGFINLAFAKGYKFAFQASSDHWSTHISFFIILAEGNDRTAILDAVKKRHCYAATDNILVDFRCGPALMGDDVQVQQSPSFDIFVHGTGPIRKIDVLRDSEVIHTIQAKGDAFDQYKGTWTDPNPQAGTHYYYVRVLQSDDEIAWGSPIWVEMKR